MAAPPAMNMPAPAAPEPKKTEEAPKKGT
jgi:hypothetical protein